MCSVGVQRQYSGTLGKTANCQLGVSVNAVTEHASCPLDTASSRAALGWIISRVAAG
jgi:SRSO17 transposase